MLLVLQNMERWQEGSSARGNGQFKKGFMCWAAESALDPPRELLKTFKQGCEVVRFIFEKVHWQYWEDQLHGDQSRVMENYRTHTLWVR